MYKNKAWDGGNNICGQKIREIREKLLEKTSQRKPGGYASKSGAWTLIKMLCRG